MRETDAANVCLGCVHFCRAIGWAAVVAVAANLELRSEELTVGGGAMRSPDTPQSSYAWYLDYRRAIAPGWAWSAAWLNEGHVQGHHRDGLAGQLWLQPPRERAKLAFSVGAGAYHFFDTQKQPDGDSRIERGVAPIVSVALTRRLQRPWFWRLRGDVVWPHDDITVYTATIGIGYELGSEFPEPASAPRIANRRHEPENEVSAFIGKTVVNASVGDRGLASSVEYRRQLAPHWQWSVSLLNEGDTDVLHRRGTTSQLWVVDAWAGQRLSLGLGAGIYYNRDRRQDGNDRGHLMALVSPTLAVRVNDAWRVRIIWHRVVTSYDRDTDVFLLGGSWRW